MPKSRDMIYLNVSEEDNCIYSYGIEFREFITSLEVPIENLLVLAGEYYGDDFDFNTHCEYVTKENMSSILEEDVYRYGDFCWVDFTDVQALKKIEPQEVAELLYLGRLMKPVTSPFFHKLNNRFAYLAHDDGWFNKFICRNKQEFVGMLAKLFPIKVKLKVKRRVIPPISPEVSQQLLDLAKEGLLIDFDRVIKFDRSLEIPIFVIGKFINMDEMYNDLQRHIGKAKNLASLVLKNKRWCIESYDRR